ncbi:MAG: glycosyltransferase [Burkholderiales bacterium]|nr:glycosyltransferase [Burkholderiales bacterium]MBW8892254.1 glycosyltransferase [Burkholderiales bacterium]
MNIGHFPAQPHCFAYGGFDIQMNRVIDLIAAENVPMVRVNPWDREVRFGVAHFWGGEESHATALRFCAERGIRTAVSVLLPNASGGAAKKLAARGFARRLVKGPPAYTKAEIVTVINDQQATFAREVLRLPEARIRVIPTIVDEVFFEPTVRSKSLPESYVLCVGTVCRRKNQLTLLRAAHKTGHRVVLCGHYDDADPAYRQEVQAEIDASGGRFCRLSGVSARQLRELYENCSLLACISDHETEPASVLEAMIVGKPVLTSERPFADNPKFRGCTRCDADSVDAMARGIREACGAEARYPDFVPHQHRASSVVASYIALYRDLGLPVGGPT